MAKDLFYSLDLNLLRTFLVLSQELNMRKASQRLFVSQPAISWQTQSLHILTGWQRCLIRSIHLIPKHSLLHCFYV